MGYGTDHLIVADYDGSQASNSVFLPELWSDEIIATFKKNLVLANLVTNMNHTGKKGQIIHIPTPSRSSASAKAASTIVTFKNPAATDTTVSINKHYEFSFLLEDILSTQAQPTLRQFLVDDAGYALATQVDQDLFGLTGKLQGGAGTDDSQLTYCVQGNDGSTTFDIDNTVTAIALTDAGIRKMIQTLDDNDVPLDNRALVVPPVEKKNLLGLARYTEQAFVGEGGGANSIRSGMIGNIYGIPVYVSSACPWVMKDTGASEVIVTSTNAEPSVDAAYVDLFGRTVNWSGTADGATRYRTGVLLHKSALALVTQLGVRTQTQYKQEYLADLFTADTIYGVGELRDNAGVCFVTNA